jgi:hypothetical protein
MNAYTYIIVRINKNPGPKFYFGYKTIKSDNGNYYGSSKHLKKDIEKYGIENFKKIIVKFYETAEEAILAEEKYLQKINAAKNPKFYNRVNGNANWTTSNKTFSTDDFMKSHYKNFLRGDQRTEAQKLSDAKKYKGPRSEKRLKADKEHSLRMKGVRPPELAFTRSKEACKKNREKINQTLREYRLGKTKENDLGRKITSEKLKGNQNHKMGDLVLAKMSEQQFVLYLKKKSQHPNVQQMLKTRRLNAQIFLQTGVWGTHSSKNKHLQII